MLEWSHFTLLVHYHVAEKWWFREKTCSVDHRSEIKLTNNLLIFTDADDAAVECVAMSCPDVGSTWWTMGRPVDWTPCAGWWRSTFRVETWLVEWCGCTYIINSKNQEFQFRYYWTHVVRSVQFCSWFFFSYYYDYYYFSLFSSFSLPLFLKNTNSQEHQNR